jgi:TM2 domain-containing membrane protein YozV
MAMMQYDANKKSTLVAYLLWFFFGWIGGHRFYLGRTMSAVGMMVLFGLSVLLSFVFIGFIGFGILAIWALVDAFLIPGMIAENNNTLINQIHR